MSEPKYGWTPPPSKWDGYFDHVAAWLYREDRGWSREAVWREADEETKLVYRRRAVTVGSMFGFPHNSKIVESLAVLCPCEFDPETTQGPERECPMHGDQPWAVSRIAQILDVAERYVNAPSEPPRASDGSYGDLGSDAPEVLYGRLCKLFGVTPVFTEEGDG